MAESIFVGTGCTFFANDPVSERKTIFRSIIPENGFTHPKDDFKNGQ